MPVTVSIPIPTTRAGWRVRRVTIVRPDAGTGRVTSKLVESSLVLGYLVGLAVERLPWREIFIGIGVIAAIPFVIAAIVNEGKEAKQRAAREAAAARQALEQARREQERLAWQEQLAREQAQRLADESSRRHSRLSLHRA